MKQIITEELDRQTASEMRKQIADGIHNKPDSVKKPGFIKLYRNCKRMLGHMQKEAYLFYELCKSLEIEYEQKTGKRLE
jgi:hypothetical protein